MHNQYILEDLSRQWQQERRAEARQQGLRWFLHRAPRTRRDH